MSPRERETRKTLLLVKGDALRLQLRLEMRLVQQRLSLAGLLGGLLQQGGSLLAWRKTTARGWRRWWRLLLGGAGLASTLSAWLQRR